MQKKTADFLIITPGVYLSGAVMILLLPVKWILSMIATMFVHELFHFCAVNLCGGEVLRIKIGIGGIHMEIPSMTPGRELICALAGPLGSFLLSLLVHQAPVIGLCALIQGIFNLLPVYPLDGGRAVRCLLAMFLYPDRADFLSVWIGNISILILLILGIWFATVYAAGVLPILIPLALWFHAMEEPPRLFRSRR